MEQDISQLILAKLDVMQQDIAGLKEGQQKLEQGQQKLEQGQQRLEQNVQDLTEKLMAQGHKLSLEIQSLRNDHGKKLDALMECYDENRDSIDNHELRLVKLEETVKPPKPRKAQAAN